MSKLKNNNGKIYLPTVLKHSLIEEWENIRKLGDGNRFVHCLTREEKQYLHKRRLEINRILLSEYK